MIGPKVFRDQVIRIGQLVDESGVLSDIRFEGCHIQGPALLIPTATKMAYNSSAEGSEHLFWEVPNLGNPPRLVGFIMVRNCIFEHCTFIKIGMTAPEPHLTEMKRGWGIESP